ncbi:MAG TPA: efflux RND transporter periplasmic adaptor subunit [Planctomycetota bacterium]|nr:efflux RND transporter periplasmic adaptor subunit [Planctomycetota bacterium]
MRASLPFLLVVLAGCTKEAAAPQGGGARPPAVVTVAEADSKDVPVYLDEIGRCAPRETVAIQAQVSGTVTQLHFADGQDVKKGDLLFTIDVEPYQAQLDLAKATLQENLAQLELAKVEVARAKRMLATKAGAQSDVDAKEAALGVADARVKASQAQIEAARINVERCAIHSPLDARAGQRGVDPGNVVVPGAGPPLVTLERFDPVYVDFTVTESELARVRGALAAGKLVVEARSPDSDEVRSGELTFLDNDVQGGTGTVRLRATLPNADRFFWPGQFVKVRLVLGTKKAAVLVPARAKQINQQGAFVYVVKKDSTVELRPVKAGQSQGDQVVVEDGLAAGEKVVLTGHLLLFPGAPVQVKP